MLHLSIFQIILFFLESRTSIYVPGKSCACKKRVVDVQILVWSCPGLRVMALAGIILTLAAGSEPVRDNEYGRRVVAQTLEDDYEALVWKARFGESLFWFNGVKKLRSSLNQVHGVMWSFGCCGPYVIRESQRSVYIALRVGFSDPGYTGLEKKLSAVGTVRRVAAADFEARVTNDENLKRRRTAQLTSLQAGSLGFVEQALALAATGGNPRSQRLAAQPDVKLGSFLLLDFVLAMVLVLFHFFVEWIAAPWRQRALAVADRISSAQSSGVKVKAMEEESGRLRATASASFRRGDWEGSSGDGFVLPQLRDGHCALLICSDVSWATFQAVSFSGVWHYKTAFANGSIVLSTCEAQSLCIARLVFVGKCTCMFVRLSSSWF